MNDGLPMIMWEEDAQRLLFEMEEARRGSYTRGGDAKRERLADMRGELLARPLVRLRLARALTLSGRVKVERALTEVLVVAVRVAVETRADVVAGAVITFQGRRYDGSWRKRLAEALGHANL